MFQVKICGITNREDAAAAVRAGADAIGLNFYEGSPRHVSERDARAIVATLPESVVKVGVFVGAEVGWQLRLAANLGLDWLQLHGDEPPATLPELVPFQVLKAFRLGGPRSAVEVVEYLDVCRELGHEPAGLLLDAFAPDARGGTGKQLDAALLAPLQAELACRPWVLAGGLNPSNVSAAIHSVGPNAVDVASGVEQEPGRKDEAAMTRFVDAARRALSLGRLSGE